MIARASRSYEPPPGPAHRGVTLVELLLVVTMLGILASYVLASYRPALSDQLRGAAQIVVADVAYARSLAVANNSRYRLTFDTTNDLYWLEHSGTNAALDALPASPYRDASDAANRQTTDLARLPALNGSVNLVAVHLVSAAPLQSATQLEFSPLGSLTRPERARIWLACGSGDARLYLPVEVDPVTGLAALGEMQAHAPALAK